MGLDLGRWRIVGLVEVLVFFFEVFGGLLVLRIIV